MLLKLDCILNILVKGFSRSTLLNSLNNFSLVEILVPTWGDLALLIKLKIGLFLEHLLYSVFNSIHEESTSFNFLVKLGFWVGLLSIS